MHVVSHGLASLVLLISGNEAAGDRIVLLELVVASGLIVTEDGGDGEVLRSSVEDNSGRLTLRGAHVHGTEINSVVPAVKGHLELNIILLVDVSVGDLTDQLSDVLVSLTLGFRFRLHVGLVLDVVREHLKVGAALM